jgi:hypothetical protein
LFSLGLRIVLSFDPRAKKRLIALFFKINNQFSSPFAILIQELQIIIVYAQLNVY